MIDGIWGELGLARWPVSGLPDGRGPFSVWAGVFLRRRGAGGQVCLDPCSRGGHCPARRGAWDERSICARPRSKGALLRMGSEALRELLGSRPRRQPRYDPLEPCGPGRTLYGGRDLYPRLATDPRARSGRTRWSTEVRHLSRCRKRRGERGSARHCRGDLPQPGGGVSPPRPASSRPSMKICFLNPWFEPYPGGIERRLLMVSSGLAARGHEVHVVCALLPGTAPHEDLHGVHVTRVPSVFWGGYRPPFAFTGVRRLRDAIQKIDPDVLDLHFRWAPDYLAVALLERRRRKCVLTYHNGHGEGAGWMRPLSQLNDRMIDTFIKRFSAVVVVSEHVRADLERRVRGLRPTNIYNGVALPSHSRTQSFRGTYLLFVGRLVPTKGLRDLLAAVATCRDEHGIAEMRLRIVGVGPEER